MPMTMGCAYDLLRLITAYNKLDYNRLYIYIYIYNTCKCEARASKSLPYDNIRKKLGYVDEENKKKENMRSKQNKNILFSNTKETSNIIEFYTPRVG